MSLVTISLRPAFNKCLLSPDHYSMRPPSGFYLSLSPPHRMPRPNFPMIFRITNLSWRLYHVRLLTSLHATLPSALLPPLPSRQRMLLHPLPSCLISHPPLPQTFYPFFLSLIPHPLVARSFFLYLLSFVFVSFFLLFIVRLSGFFVFNFSSFPSYSPLILCRMSHCITAAVVVPSTHSVLQEK